jgi:hypothetical protein
MKQYQLKEMDRSSHFAKRKKKVMIESADAEVVVSVFKIVVKCVTMLKKFSTLSLLYNNVNLQRMSMDTVAVFNVVAICCILHINMQRFYSCSQVMPFMLLLKIFKVTCDVLMEMSLIQYLKLFESENWFVRYRLDKWMQTVVRHCGELD